MTRAAVFTQVESVSPSLEYADIVFGDTSRIDRSGRIRVTLPVLDEPLAGYAGAIAELEALKAIIANPWRLAEDYHAHEKPGSVGIAWNQRTLNVIQVSQGATRKALLAVIGESAKDHPAKPFAKWGKFWLEGAKVRVGKRLDAYQQEALARYSNAYAIEASTSRENRVMSPVAGPIELSEHALEQYAARSGFIGNTAAANNSPIPVQQHSPGSFSLSLSRWLLKENLSKLRLSQAVTKRKEKRYLSPSEYWGVPEQLFRFTLVPIGNDVRRLVTVYVRQRPVGMDPEETLEGAQVH
ncbi:hypothetical protein [Halomonas sp. I5-271120]|uniref:hypothetical protein n=1 Tax=Halomonas sp. I5-271120 TaxID=3061632 RepID=UPI0027153A00|nr:hypothetical protein [Halomonas sp. I5-271120]